ncbi:hypothetical protein HSBAA_29220 [Vreelandella sulfidaeris]|uniref:Uncharacterized protein n=1 Tax=Vreelandella sulfidaeris TaxID=115553 RepID=A0A455U668_9GAMM|nr:hypothetical protein HSBAA_29220 [Halomonas sulfidaeris]
MEAAQIKPEYTNEDSYVVPFVTARLLGEFPDSTGKSPIMDGIFLGALAIHNELGSNKSALLPLYQDQDSSNTLKAVYHANIPTFLPEWFRIFSANFSRPESPKKVREYTEEIATSFGDRLAINRSLQVNILVPRDATNFISLPLSDKLKQMRYEILIGNPQDDVAETRQVVDAKGFTKTATLSRQCLKTR